MSKMEVKYGSGRDAFLRISEVLLDGEDTSEGPYAALATLREKVVNAEDNTIITLSEAEAIAYRAAQIINKLGR